MEADDENDDVSRGISTEVTDHKRVPGRHARIAASSFTSPRFDGHKEMWLSNNLRIGKIALSFFAFLKN